MKKITSLGLSLVILGGGMMTAIPAHASSSQLSVESIDQKIGNLAGKLHIEKSKIYGNKTQGNYYDQKARKFYGSYVTDRNDSIQLGCKIEGMKYFASLSKGKMDSSYIKYKKIQDEKFLNISKERSHLYKQSSKANVESKKYSRQGTTFKYQREILEKRSLNKSLDTDYQKNICFVYKYKGFKESKTLYTSIMSNISNDTKIKISKQEKYLKDGIKTSEKNYNSNSTKYSKRIAEHNMKQNSKITNLKKEIQKLEAQKSKLLSSNK